VGNAHYFVANLFRILRTKFYQNRPSFVEGMTTNLTYFFLGHGVYVGDRSVSFASSRHKKVILMYKLHCIAQRWSTVWWCGVLLYKVSTAETPRHATLPFDPLTLNIYSVSTVTW